MSPNRAGIHEAEFTCQQLRKVAEPRMVNALKDETMRERAENVARHVLSDNQGYFDWLFNHGADKETAAEIKLTPKKEFVKESKPYVQDLFDMNSALKFATDFCRDSGNQVLGELSKAFDILHQKYISFHNRVLQMTKIDSSELQKALIKFFDLKQWSEFEVKFPGVLVAENA